MNNKTGREWADYSRSGHAPSLEDVFEMAMRSAEIPGERQVEMGNIDTGTPKATPREMDQTMMQLMVDSIVKDLKDRSGLENEWDAIDRELQDEIKEEWHEIINSCWLRGHPG